MSNIWKNFKWVEIREKCPIDIDEIISLSEEVYNTLMFYDGVDIEEKRKKLLFVKSKIYAIFSRMILLLHRDDIIKSPQDEMVFLRLQENFGRVLGKLDEIRTTRLLSIVKEMHVLEIILAIDEMTSALMSYIYIPIRNAVDMCEKDKTKFVYALYHNLALTMGVYGSPARERTEFTGKFNIRENPFYVPTYERMIGESGQGELKKEWEESIGTLIKTEEAQEPIFEEYNEDNEET